MSKAAICVVVPVYKAMATLDRCVESVLAQQVEGGLTCILVDDGSPDESGALCDVWMRASPRYGEVAASRAAQSALRRIRPPPGIVGRAGTAGGSSLAGLSASWDIVRRGGLIGVARRAGAFLSL